MTRRVYLDHNASTPVHPEVVAEMTPFFGEVFGNPSAACTASAATRGRAWISHASGSRTS